MKIATTWTQRSWLVLLLLSALPASAQVSTVLSASELRFASQFANSATPGPQTVRVFSAPENLPFTAAVASANTTWLSVNNATGGAQVTGTTGTTSQDLQIRVQPAGLVPGTYSGRIDVQVQGASVNSINVQLTVGANPQLIVTQGSVVLNARVGTAALQNVQVTSTNGTPVPFTASVLTQIPATPGWLTVTPTNSNSGGSVTITADATALPVGLAVGTVQFTGNGGTVTLPVVFLIASAPTLSVSPTSTTIGYQTLTSPPSARQINVSTSDNVAVQYTAEVTAGTWLQVSNSPVLGTGTTVTQNTTPNPFWIIANPAGLQPNTYEGKIRVSSASIPGSAQEITVRLIVSTSPLLQTVPESLTLDYTLGQPVPAPQLLSVTTTSGAQTSFTATATTDTGGEWLIVNPTTGTTGVSSLQVSANASVIGTLTAGTYNGRITINSPGTGNTGLVVPVTLRVGGSTQLSVTPANLQFTTQVNNPSAPLAQAFTVASTDATPKNFTVSVEPAGTNWIAISPTSGNTGVQGQLVSVNVIPTAITQAGNYEAFIVVTPTGVANPTAQRVRVSVTANPETRITATPDRLEFNQVGTTAPPEQTVTLTSNVVPRSFIATATQPWIQISATSGEIGATGFQLRVSVNPANLTPGTHEGAVTIVGGGTLTIPVRFNLNVATITATPTTVTFNHRLGEAAPAEQTIAITSTLASTPFTAAVATQTGGNWLSVTPTTGSTAATPGTPTNLRVTVNPTGLAAGTYTGTVTITGQNATPVPVTVRLVITQPSAPSISSVLNGATNTPTAISPGLIVAIKGTNLGPGTPLGAEVIGGSLTTQRGNVRVLFDGVPAPLLYVSGVQVNAVAPYFLANRVTTRVSVEYLGQRSEALEFRVVETAPGVFTANATGSGQGAILNQDNSLNSANNPAARGTVIQIYATGEGQTSPAGQDGRITEPVASDLKRPIAQVNVFIGGRAAEVEYAGSAPGFVAGAMQVNARIPADLPITGVTALPVEIRIGQGTNLTSQPSALVNVRP